MTLVAANRSPVHPNRKSVGWTEAPLARVMISSWAAETGVDRPLVGRTDLGERGPVTGRAEADETQRVAGAGAIAREVDDGVAVRLPGIEHERVVAGSRP